MKLPKLPKIDLSKFNDISKKLSSPTAYSTYAVIGVVATTVLAIVVTRKDCKNKFEKKSQVNIFEKESEEITRDDVIDETKELIKTYAPVFISAAATIFCIKKSDQKWMAYNNLINSSYIAARDKMARYRALAAPAVGAEVIKGLNGQRSDEGVEWFCIEDPQWKPAVTSTDKLNEYLKNGFPEHNPHYIYFQSTKADVIEAEYHLNRNFALRGSASVRELFAFLGILDRFPDEYEDKLGWDVQIMMEDWCIEPWIDFEHAHTVDPDTGEAINMIYYTWEPGFTPDCEQLAWGYGGGEYRYESNLGGPPYGFGPKE